MPRRCPRAHLPVPPTSPPARCLRRGYPGRAADRWCGIAGVDIELRTPAVGELSDVVGALREWQHTDAPMQLHLGDLGWFWQFGAEATAAAVRTWSLAGQIVAVGLLDSPGVLRMTVAPEVARDERLAQRVVADIAEPKRGCMRAKRRSRPPTAAGCRSCCPRSAGASASRGRRCAATSPNR